MRGGRTLLVSCDGSCQFACYQKATKNRALENRVSSINLNVYQNAGMEKDDDSRQSPGNLAKFMRSEGSRTRIFDSSHVVHRAMIEADGYSKSSNRGEY